jgi:FAD/FMN-containing dehydrogenase
MSRMWGTCLDHVVEVEVVVADGRILRASQTQNADIFFVSIP